MGGEGIGAETIRAWAKASDMVIAVDSGIHYLEEARLEPDLIVGDLDSAVSVRDYDPDIVYLDQDEDRSDLQKLLALAKRYQANEVVLSCVHGRRLDHFLASFSAAIATDMSIRWILPHEHAVLIRPGFAGVFSTGVAKIISLLPLDGECLTSTEGLKWDLNSAVLQVGRHWSLSNESVRDAISLQVYGGHLVLMVEHPPQEVPPW